MALGSEVNKTVAGTAVSLTVPDGTNYAVMSIETAAIRVRHDGTAPTGTNGVLVSNGEFLEIYGEDTLDQIQLIRDTATSAVVNVAYGVDSSGLHGIRISK
jgi:hypothetical protein